MSITLALLPLEMEGDIDRVASVTVVTQKARR